MPLARENPAGAGVICLTSSNRFAPAQTGRFLGDYRGPFFLIARRKSEHLGLGCYFDLLGFRVWIGKTERILLKDKILTTMAGNGPSSSEVLVIENVPRDTGEPTLTMDKS